tara:strand:- start:10877 stop:11347 length:471 start_codon:yes stop_codon:yes gene_type:complete
MTTSNTTNETLDIETKEGFFNFMMNAWENPSETSTAREKYPTRESFESHLEKTWERMEFLKVVREKVDAAKIEIGTDKFLVKMWDAEMVWGGHLKNAKVRYRWDVTIKGNTFPIKDSLKSLNFRWCPQRKAWFRPITEGSIADALSQAWDDIWLVL